MTAKLEREASALARLLHVALDAAPDGRLWQPAGYTGDVAVRGLVIDEDRAAALRLRAAEVLDATHDPNVPPVCAGASKVGRFLPRYRPAVIVSVTGVQMPGRVRWGYERAMRKGNGAAISLAGLLVSFGLISEGHSCYPLPVVVHAEPVTGD